MKIISVYCIGLGQQFSGHLLRGLLELEGYIYVKALCDSSGDKADRAIEKLKSVYDQVKKYTDYQEMLNVESVNDSIVLISTPPDTHFQIIKDCLNNNCHIYVDKPFVTEFKHGEALVKLSKLKNRVVVIGAQRRFESIYRTILETSKRMLPLKKIHFHSRGSFFGMKPESPESNIFDGTGYHVVDTISWIVNELCPDGSVSCLTTVAQAWEERPEYICSFLSVFVKEQEGARFPIILEASHLAPPNSVDEELVIVGKDNEELRYRRQQAPRSMEPGSLELTFWSELAGNIAKADLKSPNDKADRCAPLKQFVIHMYQGTHDNIESTCWDAFKTLGFIEQMKIKAYHSPTGD